MTFSKFSTLPQKSRWQKYLATLMTGQKFNLITVLSILCIVVLSFVAIQGLITSQFHINSIHSKRVRPTLKLQEIQVLLNGTQTQIEKMKHEKDKNVIEQFTVGQEQDVNLIIKQYENEWQTTRDPNFTNLLVQTGNTSLQEREVLTIQALRAIYGDLLIKEQDYRLALLLNTPLTQIELDIANLSQRTQILVNELLEINLKYEELSYTAALSAYKTSQTSIIILFIILIFTTLVITRTIASSFSNRLNELVNLSNNIANRINQEDVEIVGKDEIAIIGQSIKNTSIRHLLTIKGMEKQIQEREARMENSVKQNERRTRLFEAIAQVSREIALVQDLNSLLPRITEVISQQFGYYHVGVFLLDTSREFAVLSAANSNGGKRMLLREHKLRVGQVGIVGYTTGTGSPRIALDTGADAVFFDNPDLPTTRSEMALPLRILGQVIGALDVQSEIDGAFTQEDIEVLSTLADQVSVAIQNSRSFVEAQSLLTEAQNAVTGYVKDAWKVMQTSEKRFGYKISGADIVRLEEPLQYRSVQDAIKTDNVVILKNDNNNTSLAIPIRMRGKSIGVLSIKVPSDQVWQEDQTEIAEVIAGRLSLALEAAILLQTSQRRANIERITSDITSKISSSTRFDSIVKTAAQELSKTLGNTEVLIQIEPAAIDMITER